MPKFSRVTLVLVAFCCASVLLQISSGHFLTAPTAAAATGGIAFETPSVVDPIHTFGEPDIGVDPQGRVFVSGPTGTGTQRSVWFGSVDGGHSFRTISPGPPPSDITSFEAPPGGGDTDLNFDRSGKQYFIDLYALICNRVATTSDGGATAQQNVLGCGTTPGSDRPWLAVYDPSPTTPHQSAYAGPTPLVYAGYNNLTGPGPDGGEQWNKSLDGLSYTDATNSDQSGTTLVTPADEATYSPFGGDGYPAIDQVTGKVFQAAGFPNDDGTYDLRLNIGTPNAAGNLTFLDAPVAPGGGPDYSKLVRVAGNLPGDPDVLFTVASMDTARNLFVAWAQDAEASNPGQRQVYVSAASAASGWTNWTPPVQVSDGSTATGDAANVFPWIKAGGPGRADAVWYGSDKKVDPSGNSGQKWNVFMSQVVFPTNAAGAITGAAPSKTLVKVTPHPMHYDSICLAGTGCIASQGNRNLADFFAITIDRTGAAEIVYDDTSNGLIQPGFAPDNQQLVDHSGAGVVTVARQSSGPGLYGKPVSGPSHGPVSGFSDAAGDARYPVIGGVNVPGMDIVGSQLSLSGESTTLNVTMKVVDLSSPALTSAELGAPLLHYVTRWQLGDTLYYAAMENTAANQPRFYAGKTQSVDLCSVSACFPHVLTYPEPGLGGTQETGSVQCPATPSAKSPCTITINVNPADVGSPTAKSLFEEVGAYALATSHAEGATTNAQAQADNVPLEIDGACCFNFQQKR
jgi:hypothetical protein